MLLHLSTWAELQSHLCDSCCLWTTFPPHLLPCLSQVTHVTHPEKLSSWSSFEVAWRSFFLFPHYHSYCSQFRDWTQINTLSCWNQANLGCSVLSFMVKSFSKSGFLACCYKKEKSNFSKWGAERQNPVMLCLVLVFIQEHLNVIAGS